MRLPRDERREVVGYLTGQGLSTRAIAPVLDVDQKTISNDRRAIAAAALAAAPAPAAGEEISSPALPITGLDGKAYTATPRPHLVVVPAVGPEPAGVAREELPTPARSGLPVFVDYLKTRIALTGAATAEDWKAATAAASRYAVGSR